MRKRKHGVGAIKRALTDLTSGLKSASEVANDLGVTTSTIYKWQQCYDLYGLKCFRNKSTNSAYSKEFKLSVVKEYMQGGSSLRDLCLKHNISDGSVLSRWVLWYNNGKELVDYATFKGIYHMKRRKLTSDQKLEVVKFCLDSKFNYKLTAEHFKLSYNQVFQWVKKYKLNGIDGLQDNRGHHKTEAEMTEVERLKKDLVTTMCKLECSQLELEILKKKENSGKPNFSKTRQEEKYLIVKGLSAKYTIKLLCETLDLHRSSYYKWANRKETSSEIESFDISRLILDYHDFFNKILGYRRMTLYLYRLTHIKYNKKRIRRLMKLLGVSAAIRRKRKGFIKSKPQITAENILNREFFANKPNEKWLTDVTEFKFQGTPKKLFLSAIYDIYDKSIVSYAFSNHNDKNLVFVNCDSAVAANPNAHPLLHTDRGSPYTSI
jgi:transposase-like protein